MKLILMILLTLSYGFTQSLHELYKDLMPLKIKDNAKLLKQTSLPLLHAGEINPELIYYYIKYLEEKFDTGLNDKYYSNNYPLITTYYKNQYTEWVKTLQNSIENEKTDNRLKSLCLDFIENFDIYNQTELSPAFQDRTDINKLNFIVCRYYSNNKGLIYKPGEDYKIKRTLLEKERMSRFNEMLLNPSSYNPDDLGEIFLNWHVFDNLNQPAMPSLIIINVLKGYYEIKNINKMIIGPGYSYQRDYLTLGDDTYKTTHYTHDDSRHEFDVQTFSISINYKLFLMKYIGTFCYLNSQLISGYGKVNKTNQLGKFGYVKSNIDGVPNRREAFEFDDNEIKIEETRFLSLNLTTPLLFLARGFSLDIGGGATILNTNYKINYSYNYRKYESEFLGPRIIDSESGSEYNKNQSSTNLILYPVINLNFYLMEYLIIKLGVTTNSLLFDISTVLL